MQSCKVNNACLYLDVVILVKIEWFMYTQCLLKYVCVLEELYVFMCFTGHSTKEK